MRTLEAGESHTSLIQVSYPLSVHTRLTPMLRYIYSTGCFNYTNQVIGDRRFIEFDGAAYLEVR